MKLDKQVPREAREFITQQLKEYEQTTKMNKEERHQLHEWVSAAIALMKMVTTFMVPADLSTSSVPYILYKKWMNGLTAFRRRKKRQNCPDASNITRTLTISSSI